MQQLLSRLLQLLFTLQDTVHGLSQRIDKQQAPWLSAQEDTQSDMGALPPPPPLSMAHMARSHIPQGTSTVIQRPTEMIPPHSIIPVQTTGASDDRIQRV